MYRKIQIFVLQSHLPQNINTFWLAIYYTYTHTLSLSLSVTGGKAPNESFPCYKSPVRENVAFVIPIQRFVRAKPVASTNIFQPTRIFVRRCVFFPFFLRSKRKREREKIYIYWRLNALRRSVYSWCAQGWDSSPGRETSRTGSASATAPRAREDDEEAQEVELDLEPGKYVWGCLLCYIFARRTGWPFKTPSLSLGVPLVSLGNRGDKGALSNPRKIRELSRGSPFSAPSSSHYHPTDNKRGAEIKRYTRSSSILVHSNPA